MNRIEVTQEQQMILDMADRFMRDRYEFAKRQEIIGSKAGFSDEIWSEFAEMGWLGLPFPEENGGGGGTMFDVALLMQSFGAALVVEPYLPSVVLGGMAILHGGDERQKAEILPALCAGKMRLALGFIERGAGYDHTDISTKALKAPGGFRLGGEKAVVLGAPLADFIIVSARSQGAGQKDGISLFLVGKDAPGLSLRPYTTIDGRRAAEVLLDDVLVTEDALLGGEGQGADILERTLTAGTVAVLGETAGVLDAAVRVTADYLNTREQFGRKLASFQALRHRVAKMFVLKEETKALCRLAAHTFAHGSSIADEIEAISSAKAYAGREGRSVCEEAVQLHGAIAITDEYVAGHYLKRMITLDHLFGNADHHLDIFARNARSLAGNAGERGTPATIGAMS